ncbi:MAG: hypothetical protein H7175_00480, partial [Burkholderiales bacterium]|nr:hypothetical protein [Anaerolineae bacterium]
MRRGNIVAGGVVSLLLLLSFVIVLMSTGSVLAQLDGTAQQQTLMALVDQRFTQTAKAAASTATVDLQGTANAMFFELLTATANPAAFSSPAAPVSQTTSIHTALPSAPSRTPTPLPSASPTPLVAAATQVASAESYLARGWELYWDSIPNYQSSQLAFSLAAYRDDEWAEPYVGIGLTQFQLF